MSNAIRVVVPLLALAIATPAMPATEGRIDYSHPKSLMSYWAATLLLFDADPSPVACEPVPGMRGVWRCPGDTVCRDGLCVSDAREHKPTPPDAGEHKPPPADTSPSTVKPGWMAATNEWIRRHVREVVEAGPFVPRETAGGLEAGDTAAVMTAGVAFPLRRWIAIELPFAFTVASASYSSRTVAAQPMVDYDDRVSLDVFWIPVLARFDHSMGPLKLQAGGGPELAIAKLTVTGDWVFPFFNGRRVPGYVISETSAVPSVQWFAAIEGPADRSWSLGLVYRGHYGRASFGGLVSSSVDIGGDTVSLRLTLRPSQGTTTFSSTSSTSKPHRSGFTLELGIGLGLMQYQQSQSCAAIRGCEWTSKTGLAPLSLSLGGFINNDWAILFRMAGTSYFYTGMDGSTQQFGSYFYGVHVERWLGDHWMFSAGPGLALAGTSSGLIPTSDITPGFGVSARAAYSFVPWQHHSLRVAFEIFPSLYPALLVGEAVNVEWQWF